MTFPIDTNWHHIAITYDNGDAVLYFDGIPSTMLSTGFGTLKVHSGNHNFGRTDSGDAFDVVGPTNYYEGLMDDIYHYPSGAYLFGNHTNYARYRF